MAKDSAQNYPKGKLSAEDDGQLTTKIALDPDTNTLIIDYGKPVVWLGLDTEAVAQLLTVLAKSLATMKGVPVSIVIGDEEGDRDG